MKLAIEGHSTQGSEVIARLKMLGGVNTFNLNGSETNCYYYIDNNNRIYHCLGIDPRNYIYYTLEEFLEKFPYKVGDKVLYKIYGIYSRIKSMLWNVEKEQVFYRLDSNKLFVATADELKPRKEETMEERKSINLNELEQQLDEALSKETTESLNKWLDGEPQPKAPILSNRYDYAEGKCGYVIPDGYEFDSIKQGFQTEIILRPIKSQYPKTYEECCNVLGCDRNLILGTMPMKYQVLINFQKLLICRDAYWKIAGVEMGCGKPWEPDWLNVEQDKYVLYTNNNSICSNCFSLGNNILAFPTKEMRDAFYENFKDLIEQCKELL